MIRPSGLKHEGGEFPALCPHLSSNGGASSGGANGDGASPNDGDASPNDGDGASPNGDVGASPNGGDPSLDVGLVPSPDVLPARARALLAPPRASDVPPRRPW
jgi:hypothetical protein